MATNVRTNDRQPSPRTKEKQRESTRSSPRGTAAAKATKKRTILTSERRGVERRGRQMAKKHRKGPKRRANSLARGRHPKRAEEGSKDRAKRYDREAEMEHRRQHQAIAPDGGKAKPLREVEPKQKTAIYTKEGLEMERPLAHHIVNRRWQVDQEEGHLVKPAWAATVKENPAALGDARRVTRWRRGCRSRPTRQGRARGNRARRRRRTKTHISVGQRETHQSPRQKRRQRNVEPSPPQSRPKDDKKPTLRTGWKNAPKRPTVVIPSFEIRTVDSDPKMVTPS